MATLVEVKNASKRFGDQLLLNLASVALPENCKIGMVGRNGAGKSTLARAIVGEEDLGTAAKLFTTHGSGSDTCDSTIPFNQGNRFSISSSAIAANRTGDVEKWLPNLPSRDPNCTD